MDSFDRSLSRRGLLVLAGSAAVVCGCGGGNPEPAANFARGPVDVGPVTAYAADGIYSQFRDSHGIVMVRTGRSLYALSAVCTHRACLLKSNGSRLKCPCHGSMFDSAGHVLEGPATRDLPRYAVRLAAGGRVIVNTAAAIPPDAASAPDASIEIPV